SGRKNRETPCVLSAAMKANLDAPGDVAFRQEVPKEIGNLGCKKCCLCDDLPACAVSSACYTLATITAKPLMTAVHLDTTLNSCRSTTASSCLVMAMPG